MVFYCFKYFIISTGKGLEGRTTKILSVFRALLQTLCSGIILGVTLGTICSTRAYYFKGSSQAPSLLYHFSPGGKITIGSEKSRA